MQNSDAIKQLLSRCTDIKPLWDDHLALWGDVDAGSYNEIGVIAEYLIDQCATSNTQDFERVFSTVEQIMSEADEDTKGLIIVGLLEDIHNYALLRKVDYSQFEAWLGPRTKKAWLRLMMYWESS